jgi:hypothetical protein
LNSSRDNWNFVLGRERFSDSTANTNFGDCWWSPREKEKDPVTQHYAPFLLKDWIMM